jgi:hypothetical protein
MALNRGFSAPIIQALGGWKTERMMKRYAAVTDQTLRAAAEAVSGAEGGMQAARSAPPVTLNHEEAANRSGDEVSESNKNDRDRDYFSGSRRNVTRSSISSDQDPFDIKNEA